MIINEAAEELLNKPFKVLDKGFVTLIDYMGNEHSICRSARISTGKETDDPEKDAKLIDYLYKNKHHSPFESVIFQFYIKLPILVQRQIIRHRVARVNEMSGRYRELPCEAYIPSKDRLVKQSQTNNQGSSDEPLSPTERYFHENHPGEDYWGRTDTIEGQILEDIHMGQECAFDDYKGFLKTGLSRETARINLPLSTYTEIYWQMDLRNLLHFLELRLDKHAQWETRQYAEAIASIVKQCCPITWKAFEEYTLDSITLSKTERELISLYLEMSENSISFVYQGELDKLTKRIG